MRSAYARMTLTWFDLVLGFELGGIIGVVVGLLVATVIDEIKYHDRS